MSSFQEFSASRNIKFSVDGILLLGKQNYQQWGTRIQQLSTYSWNGFMYHTKLM